MELYIKNKVIKGKLKDILNKIRIDSGYNYFKDIEFQGDNLLVTCPHHKNGQEEHPSCNIFNNEKNSKIRWGTVHCFTCGYTASLPKLVADCFHKDITFGEQWLIENYGVDSNFLNLDDEINLPKRKLKIQYLDESILNNYDYYHPYMWQRHLTKEVVDKFRVGYDILTQCITFPVWDISNHLVMVTKRSVNTKNFYIEEDKEKPIYLLNYLIKDNSNIAYICESQINALTLQGWGYPGVALFGSSLTDYQLKDLIRSGIRNCVLCLDGDAAGDKGIQRFINKVPMDFLINVKEMPRDGRDINDMTKEEFDELKLFCV